jgi:hypothetical protein
MGSVAATPGRPVRAGPCGKVCSSAISQVCSQMSSRRIQVHADVGLTLTLCTVTKVNCLWCT